MPTEWSKYLACGVPLEPGAPVPQRKEIRDLSGIELYIYLKGLAAFQKDSLDPSSGPLSYYKIAGIHGEPYENWPDAEAENALRKVDFKPGDNEVGGFCSHSSILFLTWHRPYLALFESALYKYVNSAVELIDDKEPHKGACVEAAKRFRMPYWDWAVPNEAGSAFPSEALWNEYPKDKDGMPKDQDLPLNNPLFSFRFPQGTPNDIVVPPERDDGTKWKATGATIRELGYLSDPGQGRKRMDDKITNHHNPSQNLSERVAYLLQAYTSFAPFSFNVWDPENPKARSATAAANIFGSVEDIHNSIHDMTGGGGHMSHVAISAFDPIFWLHHTNIDRLYAIWQGLWQDDKNEHTSVTPHKARKGNMVTEFNAEQNAETLLYPFRPTPTTWYTSASVKRTEDFGYYYPETADTRLPLSAGDRDKLRAKLTATYTSPARLLVQSMQGNRAAEQALLPKARIVKQAEPQPDIASAAEAPASEVESSVSISKQQAPLEVSARKLKDLVKDNKYLEWLVNIKAEKHSLGGSYSVHVFLGPPDDSQPERWNFSPHFVGTFAPFGQPSTTGCEKCQVNQEDHLVVTGQIPLTLALMERYLVGIIPDMEDQTVVDYLTRNLHWRVKKDGRNVENRADVTDLTVFVVTNGVTLPEDESKLPVYEFDVTPRPEITTNLSGSGRGNGTGLTAGDM